MIAQRNSVTKLLSVVLYFSIVILLLAHQTQQQQQAPSVECGRRKITSRIAGGIEAIANEFPWMVHFLIRRYDGQLFSCSGTLISDTHVLTAAHCVIHNETKIHDILNITLGAHDVSATDENFRQVADWKKIVIPAGDKYFEEHDIAVITLSTPITFTDYVQPACLPFENDTDHVNETVVLTGWGESSTSSKNSVLRKIEATVLSGGRCRPTDGKISAFSGDYVICSEGDYQRRYCSGDDGGPMNYYNAEWDRWFVLGVAGRGDQSVDCSDRTKLNFFTRVKSRLNFIREYSGVVPPTKIADTTESTPEELTTTLSTENITQPLPITTSTTSSTTITPANTTNSLATPTTTPTDTNTATPTSTTTPTPPTTTTTRPKFSCAGKPDGNYPDPASVCSDTFYMCSNGYTHSSKCANGTVYQAGTGVCDWIRNVAECLGASSSLSDLLGKKNYQWITSR